MNFPTGEVRWGILGCGDVTEIKSGPALQKAARSTVTAVMRRDGAKAADYAQRHGVAHWYDDADALIADDTVDAVYIATPPDSHADLTIRALEAGKPVFCEKPLTIAVAQSEQMIAAADRTALPLIVAYYRRALPRFEKMRHLIQSGEIGEPRTVEARQFMPADALPAQSWKIDPDVNGGGHFADMYSHALDWIDMVFGPAQAVRGMIKRQAGAYAAEDLVTFMIDHGAVVVSGLCSYAADRAEEMVTVNGSEGSVAMPFFRDAPLTLTRGGETKTFEIPDPPHVHQPLVERVVACLLDGAPNPCDAASAMRSVRTIATIYEMQ